MTTNPTTHSDGAQPDGAQPDQSQTDGASSAPDALLRRRRLLSSAFAGLCGVATVLCVVILVGLLATVVWNAAGAFLSPEQHATLEEQGFAGQLATKAQGFASADYWSRMGNFLTSTPSRKPEDAGVLPAVVGSVFLIVLTTLFAVPLGVGAAVFLEEYSANSRWRRLIQLNIANLAGVPSIVYGILGLALFVRTLSIAGSGVGVGLNLGRVILSGALTLTLVVLPIIILAAQEALRAVPSSIRQASYALGATRWQTTWNQVLPAAVPGIMTGVILSVARALGEAAPLVAVGAVGFISRSPTWINQSFTALPLQVFQWAGRPQPQFHSIASAAIVVLLVILILMNAGAVYARHRFGSKIRW